MIGHSGIPGVPSNVCSPCCSIIYLFYGGGRASYPVYLPSAYCAISFLLYGWAQQHTWCTSHRGPHRRRMLSVLKVFYSMAENSGIPGVPPTVGSRWNKCLPWCSIIYLFYGWTQQHIWCTFQNGPPRRHKCFLFFKFFILWMSTAAYLVYLLPWAPVMTQILTILSGFLFYGRAQRHTWCTSHRGPR
jgi:hypothetical protein